MIPNGSEIMTVQGRKVKVGDILYRGRDDLKVTEIRFRPELNEYEVFFKDAIRISSAPVCIAERYLRWNSYHIPNDPKPIDRDTGYNGVPVEGGVNHCEWNDKGTCRHPVISNGKDSLRRNFQSKRNCSLTIFGVHRCHGFLPARS